tara:strand:+ start:1582 stop:1905 length:324 start_codon:yes stop_codon:yes gene_type:complete
MIDEKLTKKEKKIVEKEIRKRLRNRIGGAAKRFHVAFKKQIVVAVSAALGFLVALSWREPIKEVVDLLINKLGLAGAIGFKFLSAVVVTLIAVVALMIVSKWTSEKE